MKKYTKFLRMTALLSFVCITFASYSTRYSIDVRNFEFSPSEITTVRIGDTLHWEWKEGTHTTTSGTIPAGAALWNAPLDDSHMTFDYIPTVNGIYNYVCTPHFSLGMIGSFIVSNPSGIPQLPELANITIYPNPVHDLVNIHCKITAGLFIRNMKLFGADGKLIREESFNEQGDFPVSFDLSGMPAGLVIFELKDNYNRSYMLKAVRRD